MSAAGNPLWNVNILETFGDNELLKIYRLNLNDNMIVVEIIMDVVLHRNSPITPEIKVLTTLHHLATL